MQMIGWLGDRRFEALDKAVEDKLAAHGWLKHRQAEPE
jgi:hypothetical protein